MKYFDAFSGMGGFSVAIKQSNPSVECIGFSEVDNHAISVYKKHFPTHINFGDITKIKIEKLPDFDILAGGFPCQSFSRAGKKKGFEDARGTLVFELARILEGKKPSYFVFENVERLISSNGGRDFRGIIQIFDECRYDMQWQILNSKNFGLPQNRSRIFIVGNLRGKPRPEVFPFKENKGESTESREVGNNLRVTNESLILIPNTVYQGGTRKVVYKRGKIFPPILASQGKSGDNQPIITIPDYRRLTPLECERLQGYEDDYSKYGCDGKLISNTQRYRMIGNAVSVPVVKAIFDEFFRSINE